ncbi:MAG: polysaccharide export protein [Bacteroidales bacterium]|nr:polysaccharide export protein [Bacteroidales bacterium]
MLIHFNFRQILFCILIIFFSIALSSCTPRKKLLYLQGLESSQENNIPNVLSKYKLRQGDMLYVKVQTMDDKTFKLFNSDWQNGNSTSELSLFVESYIVDESGSIELPIAGKINVAGLNLIEAQNQIQDSIEGYLVDASVVVKLINYKVTVLGEVTRPGTFKVYDTHINLLEALSMAGDLTVFGNRENIKVLRKSDNNKIEVLDITKANVINSDFFYLMPYDVVYVEPLKAKSLGFKEFPFTILFSSITTVIVLINFFTK